MIPIDARDNGNKYLAEPDVCKTEVDYSQNHLGSSFGFEPSIDESNQSFMFDSTEVLRRARIYAAQEAYKEKNGKTKVRGNTRNLIRDPTSITPAWNRTSIRSYVQWCSIPVLFHKQKSQERLTQPQAADLSVQDLESSVSEYNLKDRMGSWSEATWREGCTGVQTAYSIHTGRIRKG